MPVGKKGGSITFLLPNYMGGVYYNALNLAVLLHKEGYHSSFVLTEQAERPSGADIKDLSAFPNRTFTFSAVDNKHFLFKRLAEMIPDTCDVLILNDYWEYKLVTHRALHQKVLGIVHGDYAYYYDLAVASESRIDHFVCVSATIAGKLAGLLPHRKDDIVFIPSVVPDRPVNRVDHSGDHLRIIFVGRLVAEKGFDLLPLIAREMKQRGIACSWTIVAPHTTSQFDEWLHQPGVQYYDRIANKEMPSLYAHQDVLLLPSHAEGFPLSILEAMKSGVVPVATDLLTLSGTLVKNEETGFLFAINDIPAIVNILARLRSDTTLLRQTGMRAVRHASDHYSEAILSAKWTELLNRDASGKDVDRPVSSIYDRMDLACLPNNITKAMRKLKARRKDDSN